MRIVFAKQFDLPSRKAHPLQVIRTAAAVARIGHDSWILPRVRRRESAKDLVRATLGDDLPGKLHVCGTPANRPEVASRMRRRRLILMLLSSGSDLVFYSRNRVETLELLKWRRRLLRRCPIVHEFHNLDHLLPDGLPPGVTPEMSLRQETDIWNKVNAVTAISSTLCDELYACFGESRRVTVVPSAVDLKTFSAVTPGTCGDGPIILTYCGGLYAYKGVDALLDALTLLPEQYHLRIVGGSRPDDLSRLTKRADEDPRLRNRIDLRGQVAAAEVPGNLAGSHLLLMPTSDNPRAQKFTSPIKLFEYLATGIPIIAAPAPSILSVITDGQDAFVAKGSDGSSLAAAIVRAMEDEQALQQVGRRARERAKEYTWEKRAERVVAVCRESLECRHRSRSGSRT